MGMAAAVSVATLTCCANSHPFQERRITLAEPVKIGRSVAQSRPGQTNGIFDCKVLSRNHALLWYDNGKFLLQDTKSSNGTFVNGQRLSKGSEESTPFEVYSQDTVQFGVDVMENSRKVTHSCIIATIQLFHPDGREALNSSLSAVSNPAIKSQELCQLAQCLQEALHREQMLENKLATLQTLVASTKTSTENGWQAMIDEDRLLSRLCLLENQLNVYAKNQTDETLQREVLALHADKLSYENTAKDLLRQVLEEKLEAVHKVSDLERALSNSEDEVANVQSMYQTAQELLQRLAETNEDQTRELHELNDKLREVEKRNHEELERLANEKQAVEEKLELLTRHEDLLHAKIESLQADSDFTHEQLNNMQAKLESCKKSSTESLRIPESISCGVQVELVNLLDLQVLQCNDNEEDEDEKAAAAGANVSVTADSVDSIVPCAPSPNLSAPPDGSNEDIDSSGIADKLRDLQASTLQYRGRLEQCTAQLESSQQLVTSLQKRLQETESESVSRAAQIASLQSELQEARQAAAAAAAAATTVSAAAAVPQLSVGPVNEFKSHIVYSDSRPQHERPESNIDERLAVNTRKTASNSGNIGSVQQEMQRESAKNRAEFAALKEECAGLRQRIQDIESDMKRSNLENVELKAEYTRLQESYRQLERIKESLQDVQTTCQLNLTDAQKDADNTKTQLTDARQEIVRLLAHCTEQEGVINKMQTELDETVNEYGTLSFQCRALSIVSLGPLFLLLFAILLAFYPVLATVTATTTPDPDI